MVGQAEGGCCAEADGVSPGGDSRREAAEDRGERGRGWVGTQGSKRTATWSARLTSTGHGDQSYAV
jgi:hypothetical protein